MKVSVIFCHHQGSLIYKAIESCKNSIKIDPEIIVVTSQEDFTAKDCKVVYWPGQPAAKRNVGAEYASSPYIAYFDDDVEITPDAIYEMLRILKRDKVGMVFGKLLNMEHRTMFDEAGGFLTWTGFIWARGDRKQDVGQFEKTEPIFAGKSAACMIHRGILRRHAKFDEYMGILGEESDLAWRVWLLGWKVMYAPQSVTFHAFNTKYKPRSFYTDERVFYNGCRNYITMLVKNLGMMNLIKILPIHVMCWVVSGIGMFIKGNDRAGQLIFKGIWYCIANHRRLSGERRKSQSLRRLNDDELFKVIYRSPSWGYYAKRFFRYIEQGLHG